MPYTKPMQDPRRFYWLWCIVLALIGLAWPGPTAAADDDPRAYDAAVYLLSQTTQPYRDGRHNGLLLGLRHLGDADLAPLYEALAASPHAPQRLHGQLGLAEISPAGRLDLAVAAEVQDARELTELLGAAIDGGLLDTADLTQVIRWEVLDPSAQLALAVRIVAGGGLIDEQLLRRSLLGENDAADGSKLLSHGLAALLLMERGALSAEAKLDIIDRYGRVQERDAVRAQLLEVAYRHAFKTLEPWALALAQDEDAELPLRLAALRAALSFAGQNPRGPAIVQWQAMYRATDDPAGRIRLALLALESAHRSAPALFSVLVEQEDAYLRLIGEAGQAVAGQALDPRGAVLALVAHGQPLTVQWSAWYAREHASASDRGPILAAIIEGAFEGSDRTRARRIEYAIVAAQGLAELEPDGGQAVLLPMLTPDDAPLRRGELAPRHVVLLGLVRARKADLSDLAAELPEQNDPDARDLALLLRARWSDDLSAQDWSRVSQIVAGVSSLDPTLRIQLAWLYLKHIGREGDALRAVTATRR